MNLIKLVLNADFLLLVLGMFWLDIAGYIQNKVATCNPKLFGFVLASLIYIVIKTFVS